VQEECVTQGGWIFKARKAPIIGSLLLEEYSNKLGGVLTLPEILFGNSSLQLKHEASGLTLTFSAFEALQQWKADSLPPLKVALAKEWQAARQQEIEQQQATVLDYDWTYTTSYAGDLSTQPAPNSSSTCDKVNPADQPSKTAAAAAAAAAAAGNVFKPPAAAGVVAAAAAAVGVPGTDAAAADGAVSSTVRLADQGTPSSTGSTQQQQQQQQLLPEWQPTERQIDRHMLMSKHEPILFYAEVPLYESELDDNGVCQLTVKVGNTAMFGLYVQLVGVGPGAGTGKGT
jgi:type 2A phosphatase activator TIP41